ncbi:hypothetical protein COCC4DRAFT_59061 [Bipolaris maydis ATCC 48331]|uniref:Uncharacterized protein n=2 Tax=Cochliobolus heterostrophus TaxID=5016 RepID=M2U451_COCH5|nr:uncharacterized protein COCC4DRAFT_59061 [Bipolaris maydis ATCC 48331]EMD93314.1 hypothetical protein COCHEDRAFT_1212040 [Bipolaris maydis C5]KAJ5027649.1 hypothetical protein J3E73DRAFT_368041 [Bipolaris maydis]ENI07237.1 hypothetical protein COCC4DRAFT_59061 [Bipolaris maydis ATCC 48331]KAJ5062404.1 hypothetical protein J3E74DRAFT_404055 [Bipolaris maydis]KAJ6198680.1 hypothetical protein J3E72DRAFT_373165 [Bipolaris maydis]
MKSFVAILAFASCALTAPIAQGSYDGYGDYSGVKVPVVASYGTYENAPPVETPNPPAAYASYGTYPPPAGGYDTYTGYKKE